MERGQSLCFLTILKIFLFSFQVYLLYVRLKIINNSERLYLDKPGLPVFVLLVHVEFGQLHLQVQSLDAHQDRPAVRRPRGVVDFNAWPTHQSNWISFLVFFSFLQFRIFTFSDETNSNQFLFFFFSFFQKKKLNLNKKELNLMWMSQILLLLFFVFANKNKFFSSCSSLNQNILFIQNWNRYDLMTTMMKLKTKRGFGFGFRFRVSASLDRPPLETWLRLVACETRALELLRLSWQLRFVWSGILVGIIIG